MRKIGYWALGHIPGIASLQARGEKRVGKTLEHARGDADVVGLVRGNDGWELVPGDIRDEGDEQWVEPHDPDERPYPADGIPDTPPRLWGVPVCFGYKDFGCLNEVPNTRIRRETATLSDLVGDAPSWATDDSDDSDTMGDNDDATDTPSRRERLAAWWRDRRLRTGLSWLQSDAEAVIIKQDGDAVLSAKRADYNNPDDDGPEWYETRSHGYYYDARGHGAAPEPFHDTADIALAYAPYPKLLAPVICRIARNHRAGRLVTDPAEVRQQQAGGPGTNGAGEQAVADGGATPLRHNDIIVEERAMVWPADIRMLGGSEETQERIETLERQVRAKENPPGGEWLKNAGRIGIVLLAAIIGMAVGDPSGVIELLSVISAPGVVG